MYNVNAVLMDGQCFIDCFSGDLQLCVQACTGEHTRFTHTNTQDTTFSVLKGDP